MFPGLPTSLSGAYVIESQIDEECQGNLVTHLGKPYGIWFDDSTPSLDHWLSLAVQKYAGTDQRLLVAVPPGGPMHHYPAPIISVYEAYCYGMGVAPSAFFPLPTFDAYCVQWLWPGTHGKQPPTPAQRERLLKLVEAKHPSHIFLF